MTDVVVEFLGSSEDIDREARHLADWLNDSRDLRGLARCRVVPPAPGEQGGFVDAVTVLGSAAVALGGPLFAWLSERAKTRQVRFRITDTDGRGGKQEIEVSAPADLDGIVSKIGGILERWDTGDPS